MTAHQLPSFEAVWWPIFLETVPGSSEQLCVAVLMRAASGQAAVRQAISPDVLRSLFGSGGKGMTFIIEQTVQDLQRQLNAFTRVEELDFAFGGFRFGTVRDCVARDSDEVFDIAMRLGTAFSQSPFGAENNAGDTDAQLAFDEWTEQVREHTLAGSNSANLADAFNVQVPILSAKRLRIGFVRGGYVAQFGVLRVGKSLNTDQRALKLKLFDLEVLRRENALAFHDAELIVGVESPGDSHPKRQREALIETWDFITRESSLRGVTPLRYPNSHAAAEYLRQRAA